MMYPVDVAIRVSEWETRARTSTRLEFDSTHTRPAAYSSISHGTRVVGRVTSHFVSTDYFRHNSVCTEQCDATRCASAPDYHTTLDSRWSHVHVSQVIMTGNCPHYREIDHGVSFSQLNRGAEFNFGIDILVVKKNAQRVSILSFLCFSYKYIFTFFNFFSYYKNNK